MHPIVIHSYPARSYRDPESQEAVWIRIPVLLCREAKAHGKQYTKRLLPDFLIPGSRMRLDAVVEAGRRKESGSTLEECCRILGCIDLRTARMHMERLEEAATEASLTLAESQAAVVHLHEHTYQLRPFAPLERLAELCRREEEAQLRGGGDRWWLVTPRPLLQTALWKNYRKNSTSYVCRPPPQS